MVGIVTADKSAEILGPMVMGMEASGQALSTEAIKSTDKSDVKPKQGPRNSRVRDVFASGVTERGLYRLNRREVSPVDRYDDETQANGALKQARFEEVPTVNGWNPI